MVATLHLSGLEALRSISIGLADVTVAVIDGPVAVDAPQFDGAMFKIAPGLDNQPAQHGAATAHGTFIASLLFARDSGLCPGVCGLFAPILADRDDGKLVAADQFGLARALDLCVEAGASIINVSAGQSATAAEADQILARALERCAEQGVLVIAAAGNGGCDCAELPAAATTTVAVGSHDDRGAPSRFSNFGSHYQSHGLLAPGEGIASFGPDGAPAVAHGTSYAAAIVSGVSALLLSAARASGLAVGPRDVGRALLDTAAPCPDVISEEAASRCLVGRLDILAAMDRLGIGPGKTTISTDGGISMNGIASIDRNGMAASGFVPPGVGGDPASAGIRPSDCGCGCGGESKSCGCGGHGKAQVAAASVPQLVYGLGTLDVDFGTEARRDAFLQAMPDDESPHNPAQLAAFLAANPVFEQGLTWILRLDASPIYAIRPAGTYARETAERLREIYQRQFDQEIEIVSVPGYMAGQARLLSGMAVPIIFPDIRGVYAWDVPGLARTLDEVGGGERDPAATIQNFLNRVYYEFRNLGVTPQERALNYSATNAFQVNQVFGQALGDNLVLDGFTVTKSPICRPESDCWDVVLTFFPPSDREKRSRMNYRFTVDVSDVLPVLVGPVRSWAIY